MSPKDIVFNSHTSTKGIVGAEVKAWFERSNVSWPNRLLVAWTENWPGLVICESQTVPESVSDRLSKTSLSHGPPRRLTKFLTRALIGHVRCDRRLLGFQNGLMCLNLIRRWTTNHQIAGNVGPITVRLNSEFQHHQITLS